MFPRSSAMAAFARPIILLVLAFALLAITFAAELPAPVLIGDKTASALVFAAGDAALFPFLPVANKSTGAAVLIVPAAGFSGNQLDATSLAAARWLAERGVAAFIFRRSGASLEPKKAAIEMALAWHFLRLHAAEFKVAGERVGVMGFGQGAALAAELAYGVAEATAPSAEQEKKPVRPAFLALVWGTCESAAIPADAPPTFLVGSTLESDRLSGLIDLWTKLRAAHISVDAHFFAKNDSATNQVFSDPSSVTWPEAFYAWARFQGFLTEQPRLALQGMVYLDGNPLPQGYVIFTPVGFVGAGPVIARVINSTAGVPIGQFTVPSNQGPIAGRYKVDVRQNMNRWLSNSFTGALVNARNGVTPEQAYFGHHRALSPSIDDQHAFTQVHPGDREEYTIEFRSDPAANNELKIEVFSR